MVNNKYITISYIIYHNSNMNLVLYIKYILYIIVDLIEIYFNILHNANLISYLKID